VPGVRDREGGRVALAYAAYVLIGVSAGVGGVLLPAQIRDYDVSKATIGFAFLTGSVGFLLAGSTAGALIHRFGTRAALAVGGASYLVAALGIALRPVFVLFLLLQVLVGYGTGALESVLNAYLAGLRDPTGPLNRLHAFFGVGALIGPSFAALMLRHVSWPIVWLVLALLSVPMLVAFLLTYPQHTASDQLVEEKGSGLMLAALRERAVVLSAVFLSVYVGLELSLGTWGFTFLVEERGQRELLAGYAVTGYWLGLTVGRFVISPIGIRIGLTSVDITFGCLVGIAVGAALIWLVPTAAVASLALALLGFFLAPLFPTVMSLAPKLTVARLVPTAVGVMVGVSVIGGAIFPWLAGVLAQAAGAWTLMPYAITLSALLAVVWWRTAQRLPAP
jgi:fucose permease